MTRPTIIAFSLLVLAQASAFAGETTPTRQVAVRQEIRSDSTTTTRLESRSPRGAMLRSLAFPGWGQFYNGQYIKSVIVLSTITVLVAQAVHFNNKAGEAGGDAALRAHYVDRRNLRFWLIGAATMLSMIDAYIDAHLYDFDAGPDLSLRAGVLGGGNRTTQQPVPVGVSIRARF